MKREFLDYVEDIVEEMSDVIMFTEGMEYEDFIKDKKTNKAVLRSREVIGEAVKNIPRSIKNRYPEILWKEMAGMRDKIIHEYFGVRLDVVWDTAKNDIPALKPLFDKVLEDFKDED